MAEKEHHIPREKIALIMFFALLLLGAAFVGSYFFMGRELNTTATVVDDATGNMQDYALVVFSGISDDRSKYDETDIDSNSGEDAYAAGLGQDAAVALKEKLADAYLRANVNPYLWKNHVFVSEVREAYELKGADVATIDLSNLSKYSKPIVVDSGSRKFGIFSVKSYLSRASLKSHLATLKAKGAQSVICITPNTSLLSSFNGLDGVVSLSALTDEEKYGANGGTLLVESPAKGNVGVMLFSRSNVTSYKTIKKL